MGHTVYTLAGILVHEHNTPFLEFNAGHVSCCHHDVLRSMIECKLITHHYLATPSHLSPVLQLIIPLFSVKREADIAFVEHPHKKTRASGQSLLTN